MFGVFVVFVVRVVCAALLFGCFVVLLFVGLLCCRFAVLWLCCVVVLLLCKCVVLCCCCVAVVSR